MKLIGNLIKKGIRLVFFNLFIRPIVFIFLGVRMKHPERLPQHGPAIVVANHNSHLDAMVLLTIFPRALSRKLRPVAAADYFLKNRLIAWFSLNVIGIIPLSRQIKGRQDPFEACCDALDHGDILIIFPEGSRGEPERMTRFKSGVAHLAKRFPGIPVVPVYLHGLGKALPRGEFLLVPFYCDVVIGEPTAAIEDKDSFMDILARRMDELAAEGNFPSWE